ncbi:MAU2 chromatid cohesion factor homolog [Phlebotomus papatasi]|uniref:MAU2 chromatid cohesion factor homolog n=1 Tax=Phlebotomus papatasi TaxID=29031 RepID=A0A1B0DJ39_PHLPP|nr:MAU2 chromatid cohesion factor homolog [Phlebotomus papatasi]
MSSSQDSCYISLLGLAEHFRTSNPPEIKKSIQCLQALNSLNPPQKVEARTNLQIGQLLMAYTSNYDLARVHLEQAWTLAENILAFDDVKFVTASLLAQLYQQQDISSLPKSNKVLRKAIELSQSNVYWHCRLLLQLAQLHATNKQYGLAAELLSVGIDVSEEYNATFMKILFMLSKAMVLIVIRKTNEVSGILNQAGAIIETHLHNPHQKEYLKVFYLVLQVCYYLVIGQVKTVKPYLKLLQQSIQVIMAPNFPSDEAVANSGNSMENIMWLPKEQLYVLVYLVTVSHSMMAGYMDKAQKYTEKALSQIDKLKQAKNQPILYVFQIILMENIIMCRLVMGNKFIAIQEISFARDICLQSPNSRLAVTHSAQLHCLLGLYSMSISLFEHAERQFISCIEETHDKELKLFANLNLAIVYLRTKREQQLGTILEAISVESAQSLHNQALLGSFYYIQGLNSFYKSSFHDAKRFLRETLKMANSEDLNRLTACTLVLLSHVFLSIGNSKESMNMVTPAMQVASKIPDIHVQLWGSAILKDLHRMSRDSILETEAYNNHLAFSQTLLADHYKCTKSTEHNLINWFTGIPPPSTPGAGTSTAIPGSVMDMTTSSSMYSQ